MDDQDKRKYYRIDERIKIDCRIITLGDKPHRNLEFSGYADMENISVGGILFDYGEEIPTGSIIEISFYVSEDINPLFMRGRVIRSTLLPQGHYDIAVEFLESFEADRRMLLDHIAHRIEKRDEK